MDYQFKEYLTTTVSKLPCVGPHMAVNFIWKQPKDEEGKAEQTRFVSQL